MSQPTWELLCHLLLVYFPFSFYKMHKSDALLLMLFKTSYNRWTFYTDTISGQGFFLPIAKSERLADLTTIRVAVVSAVLCEMCVAILFLGILFRHDAHMAVFFNSPRRFKRLTIILGTKYGNFGMPTISVCLFHEPSIHSAGQQETPFSFM